MKNIAVLLVSFSLAFCTSHQKPTKNCKYLLKKLFEDYDTARFDIVKIGKVVDVYDKSNKLGERGAYRFDEKGTLRFYGYMLNSNNDYYFGVEFDSSGYVIKEPKGDVVRWYVNKQGTDSLRISFFVSTLYKAYGDVRLKGDGFNSNIPLLQSTIFSNLIGGDLIIKRPIRKEVYITGKSQNKCSQDIKDFKDSVYLTNEFLK